MPPQKESSPLWAHFVKPEGDFRKAKCNHCEMVVSRGAANAMRKNCYNRNMQAHLKKYHP